MAMSGQITVTTAGTEVQGTSQPGTAFLIKALPTNTGVMYIGESSGGVSSSTGFPLSVGDAPVYCEVKNLNQIWVDATVSGEKVAWFQVIP